MVYNVSSFTSQSMRQWHGCLDIGLDIAKGCNCGCTLLWKRFVPYIWDGVGL